MQTEIKAPFTRDQINLGPTPDWVQIGFAFTRDLLELVRCGPLTQYDVGPLEERSKYGPGPSSSRVNSTTDPTLDPFHFPRSATEVYMQ